jgi:hypothetical protein
MVDDHVSIFGMEYAKRSERHGARTVLFASIVIIVHLLNIRPSEIEAGGLKIAIDNPIVLRGAVSIIFLYFLFQMTISALQGDLLLPWNSKRAMLKNAVKNAKKPFKDGRIERHRFRTPDEIKSSAKGEILLFDIVSTPFYIVIILFVISALFLATSDTWEFSVYAYNKSDVVEVPNEMNALVGIAPHRVMTAPADGTRPLQSPKR